MRTEFLCLSVLRVTSGPRVKLADRKSALTPPPSTHTHTSSTPPHRPPPPPPHRPPLTPVAYSIDRSKAVVPALLTLCCFVVYPTRRFILCLALCYFVLVFFSPFSIAITPLGEERELVLVLFVRLLICACLVLSVSPWCLGRAAVCDCGTPWTFLLPFFFFLVYKYIKWKLQLQKTNLRTCAPSISRRIRTV